MRELAAAVVLYIYIYIYTHTYIIVVNMFISSSIVSMIIVYIYICIYVRNEAFVMSRKKIGAPVRDTPNSWLSVTAFDNRRRRVS